MNEPRHERAERMNTRSQDITVNVNGQAHTLLASTPLSALVDHLGHAPGAVATAVNGEFVARAQRHEHVLYEGDRVTLFQPIVGG
ncbi:hypothetical protein BH11PSE9_BH11PSE9_11290 [soil metagenome]